jgi:hypothetical protein
MMRAVRDLENSPMMKALKGIEDSPAMNLFFSDMANIIRSFDLQPLTFSEALQEVARAYERAATMDVAEPWEEVTSEFEERTIHAPKGRLSAEFYLTLVITLVLFLLSLKLSSDSEDRILNRIKAMEAHIMQLVALQGQGEKDIFYIVERSIAMRYGPNTKTATITLLYPNIKVRVIERRSNGLR